MFAPQQEEWVILGRTLDGDVFAIPDWADRLCGMLAAQAKDNRLSYSNYLHPSRIDGLPAVVMRTRLAQDDPQSFDTVKRFVDETGSRPAPVEPCAMPKLPVVIRCCIPNVVIRENKC